MPDFSRIVAMRTLRTASPVQATDMTSTDHNDAGMRYTMVQAAGTRVLSLTRLLLMYRRMLSRAHPQPGSHRQTCPRASNQSGWATWSASCTGAISS